MSKFDIDALRSKQRGNASTSDVTEMFKKTEDIFDKANSAIENLPIDKLVAYSKHPFKIRDNEHLAELTESIKEQGVLIPLIVRVHPELKGRYEILSGHHRQVGAQKANLSEVPCVIRNVDDNMAALIVVESNKQRGFSDMLPSEIAFALKLEHEALKSQGSRNDLRKKLDEIMSVSEASNPVETRVYSTSCTVCTKLDSGQNIAYKNDMSRRTFYQYIRLTFLISPLLDLVDSEHIAIRPAVDLSYLKEDEQEIVLNVLDTSSYKIDMKIAEKLKEYSQVGKLSDTTALSILSGEVFDKKAKPSAKDVKLPIKKIQEYIPSSITPQKYDEYIIDALKFYQENKK